MPQQQQKQKATLVETVAQETEGRSTKRSSKADNLRGGFDHHEHLRPDGWTSTPRGSDDEKNCSERDKTAGERLQNQRPHPLVRIGGEEDAHEIDTRTGCSSGCDLRAGERLPKQRPLGDEHPERNPEEHLGAQIPHQEGFRLHLSQVNLGDTQITQCRSRIRQPLEENLQRPEGISTDRRRERKLRYPKRLQARRSDVQPAVQHGTAVLITGRNTTMAKEKRNGNLLERPRTRLPNELAIC